MTNGRDLGEQVGMEVVGNGGMEGRGDMLGHWNLAGLCFPMSGMLEDIKHLSMIATFSLLGPYQQHDALPFLPSSLFPLPFFSKNNSAHSL